MKTGIYGIHNVANGMWYVGQTIDIKTRRRHHLWTLKNLKHFNKHLQRAFLKYGENNFEFRILEECPENMLDTKECAWIKYYNSGNSQFGYNLDTGGNLNKHHSIETRRKISEAHKGKTFSAEHCRHISEIQKGRTGCPHSEESKRKLSEARKGIVFSAEHCRKLSEARKSRPSNRKGCTLSEITRKKLSEINKGKRHSEATKQKMRESHKKFRVSVAKPLIVVLVVASGITQSSVLSLDD